MPRLGDPAGKGSFIQVPKTYCRLLQQIFRPVESGAGEVLKRYFVLAFLGGGDGLLCTI